MSILAPYNWLDTMVSFITVDIERERCCVGAGAFPPILGDSITTYHLLRKQEVPYGNTLLISEEVKNIL